MWFSCSKRHRREKTTTTWHTMNKLNCLQKSKTSKHKQFWLISFPQSFKRLYLTFQLIFNLTVLAGTFKEKYMKFNDYQNSHNTSYLRFTIRLQNIGKCKQTTKNNLEKAPSPGNITSITSVSFRIHFRSHARHPLNNFANFGGLWTNFFFFFQLPPEEINSHTADPLWLST